GTERLRALGSIAVNGHALKTHLPGLHVSVPDVGDGTVIGHVDGLGNGAADERLGGAHHAKMGQGGDAALATVGFEGAIKNRQVTSLEAAGDGRAILGDVLDGVEFNNV